jgi:hypothetical protein
MLKDQKMLDLGSQLLSRKRERGPRKCAAMRCTRSLSRSLSRLRERAGVRALARPKSINPFNVI